MLVMSSLYMIKKNQRAKSISLNQSPKINYIGGHPYKLESWELDSNLIINKHFANKANKFKILRNIKKFMR